MIPSDTFLSLLHLDFVLLLHKNSFVRITKDFFEFAKSCGWDSVHLLDLSAASESSHCSFLLRALSLVGHASSLAFLLALWLLLLNMFLLASSHFSVLMGEPGLIYLVFFSFYLIHSVTLQCFHGFKYLPMSWWILMYLSSLKPSPNSRLILHLPTLHLNLTVWWPSLTSHLENNSVIILSPGCFFLSCSVSVGGNSSSHLSGWNSANHLWLLVFSHILCLI